MKNWRDAQFVQTFTPKDVYDDGLEYLLKGIKDSFLQIVAFEIPKPTDFYLIVFGHANQQKGVDKPHFILELKLNKQGEGTCPICNASSLALAWAMDTHFAGCCLCGKSVIKLRLLESL